MTMLLANQMMKSRIRFHSLRTISQVNGQESTQNNSPSPVPYLLKDLTIDEYVPFDNFISGSSRE
jgi:hypothetical protein